MFLQTARAVIHRPSEPHVSLEVRLILDGGSQKSYISQRVCDLLNLAAVREQSLSIATFGSSKGAAKVCSIVQVGMDLKGYSPMLLSLYVVPTICKPLMGQPIAPCTEQYPHLTGLELADCSSNDLNMPVDVLIGSDYYWHIVTGNIRRGMEGPVAIHIKLGWVLSGPMSHSHSNSDCSVTNLSVHVLHAELSPSSLVHYLTSSYVVYRTTCPCCCQASQCEEANLDPGAVGLETVVRLCVLNVSLIICLVHIYCFLCHLFCFVNLG